MHIPASQRNSTHCVNLCKCMAINIQPGMECSRAHLHPSIAMPYPSRSEMYATDSRPALRWILKWIFNCCLLVNLIKSWALFLSCTCTPLVCTYADVLCGTMVTARRPSLNWDFSSASSQEIHRFSNCSRSLTAIRQSLEMLAEFCTPAGNESEMRKTAHERKLSERSKFLWEFSCLSKPRGCVWRVLQQVGVCFYFQGKAGTMQWNSGFNQTCA